MKYCNVNTAAFPFIKRITTVTTVVIVNVQATKYGVYYFNLLAGVYISRVCFWWITINLILRGIISVGEMRKKSHAGFVGTDTQLSFYVCVDMRYVIATYTKSYYERDVYYELNY